MKINPVVLPFLCFGLFGCATSSIQHIKQPQHNSISNKDIVLAVTASSTIPDSQGELDFLEGLVISKLREKNIFLKVYSKKNSLPLNDDKVLKIYILQLRKVSPNKRAWLGGLVGRASIEAMVVIIDSFTEQVLKEAVINGKTGAHGFAGIEDEAIVLAADKIVDFVIRHSE